MFESGTLSITECSAGLCELLRHSGPSGIVGRTLFDLVSSESMENLEAVLRGRAPADSTQCTLLDAEGSEVHVALHIHMTDGDTKRQVLCIPVQNHEKQLQQLRAQLAELTRQNQHVLALTRLANHDLRNILQSMVSNIDLLELTLQRGPSATSPREINLIRDGAYTMSHMLNGVLQLVRFDIGDYPMSWTDLNPLVDQVSAQVRTQHERDVDIRRASSLPALTCQPQLVSELFRNLIGNAVKHAQNNRLVVEIGANNEAGDQHHFYVRDNGDGIAASAIPHLFNETSPPEQTPLTLQSSGMGMSLVKMIVQRHGGDVWLEQAAGPGTCVHFTLSKFPSPSA